MKHRNRWWVHIGVVGVAIAYACSDESPDSCACPVTNFAATATGNGVATHKNPADTTARATFDIHWDASTTYTYTNSMTTAPHGTVNRILILKRILFLQGDTLTGDTVTLGTLCSAAPCAARGPVRDVTDTQLYRRLRNVDAKIRVYTDSDPAGALEGVILPTVP